MVEIGPLTPHLLMRLRQQRHRLAPTIAPFLATRDTPLRRFQRALRRAIPAGMEDACPIRERSEGFQPKVYARFLAGRRQRLHRHIRAGETDIPPIRLPTDRDRLGDALQRAAPAYGNAPNLGADQEAVVERRPVAKLLVGEGV